MLTKRKDEDGKIVGYIEWVRLNDKNIPDDDGNYVFIRYAWVHDSLKHSTTFYDMFIELCNKTPKSNYVYWEKHKCNDKLECFNKHKLLDIAISKQRRNNGQR